MEILDLNRLRCDKKEGDNTFGKIKIAKQRIISYKQDSSVQK